MSTTIETTTPAKKAPTKRAPRRRKPAITLREARAWAAELTTEQVEVGLTEHANSTTTDGQNRHLALVEESDRRRRPVEPESATVVEEAAEDAELADLPMSTNAEIEAWHAGSDTPAPIDPRTPEERDAVVAIQAALATGNDRDVWQQLPEETKKERIQTLVPHVVHTRTSYGLPKNDRVEPAEGVVQSLEEIEALRKELRLSPTRVWGTGVEQARQATAWGYDGVTFPGVMAPDATPQDWATVQTEVRAANAKAKEAAALAAWEQGMVGFRTVADHTARWSTEEDADPTVCVHPDCGKPRNEHADVPAHVPTEAEWAEITRRAAVAGDKPAQTRQRTRPVVKAETERVVRPAAAPAVAANTGDVVELDLAAEELVLAYASLGRYAYRAFDTWGDLLAPFREEGPVRVSRDRATKLAQALEDHAEWARKVKAPNAVRIYAADALAQKVAALIDRSA